MENIEKLRLHGEEREHTSTSTTSLQHNTQILRYRSEKSRLLVFYAHSVLKGARIVKVIMFDAHAIKLHI